MDFHKVTLEDKEWIKKCLSVDKFYGAEYCFSSMIHWQDMYKTTVGRFKDFAVIKSNYGKSSYCYFGSGDRAELIAELEKDAKENGQELRLHSVLEIEKERLNEALPDKFDFTENRDSFDYCYDRESLAELKGRKLSAKRNHIKKFLVSVDDWKYEEINSQNLPECKEMSEIWYKKREELTGENLDNEKTALFTALKNFEEEDLFGGLIRINGKVEAFSLGHQVNDDTVVVHFEKANREFDGLYPMINQQFVQNSCEKFSRINREDDTGAENLRKAKKSYIPSEMLVKYIATVK